MASNRRPGTGYAHHGYSAAKAAVIHLTKSVAMELAVRVNCLCPGAIAKPIFAKWMGMPNRIADRIVEPMKEALTKYQPSPRDGVPGDVAYAALFLASDESAFVNGAALVVDGGASAGRRWSEYLEGGSRLQTVFGVAD